MSERWLDQLTQTLAHPADASRVFIIHPHLVQRHLALKALPSDALYIRFNGLHLDSAALEEQFNTLMDSTALKSDSIIVLDEADRALSDELVSFVEANLRQLTRGTIVILTRVIPLALLKHPALRGKVQLVPTNDGTMLSDYAQPGGAQHLLEVWALGGGRALLNGRAIDNWDGLLPKTLFYFLVDRGITTRTDIFERFWHNLPAKEAANVFHVTKRKINELLKADLMIYESSFYRIAPEIYLRYDVSLFHQYIQESAAISGAAKRDLLLKAISLYRAPFIHSLDTDWARSRRDEMAEAYADALAALGEVYAAEGNEQAAFVSYLRAFQQQPRSAEIVAPILRLGGEQQRDDEARSVYHQYLNLLDGSAPKPELAELYDALS